MCWVRNWGVQSSVGCVGMGEGGGHRPVAWPAGCRPRPLWRGAPSGRRWSTPGAGRCWPAPGGRAPASPDHRHATRQDDWWRSSGATPDSHWLLTDVWIEHMLSGLVMRYKQMNRLNKDDEFKMSHHIFHPLTEMYHRYHTMEFFNVNKTKWLC